MIARALIHKPQILILDEPTAGVDIELRRSMWEFMKKLNAEGTTIILTTHYLEEAEQLCKNIAIINNGEIVTNTSVRKLLSQLKTETFILDVEGDLDNLPTLTDFELLNVGGGCLEVAVSKGQSLNDVFSALIDANIQVRSMRTKANRLEELFVNLVQGHKDTGQHGDQRQSSSQQKKEV
jgi:ABC-2 type transport system ATP-binding protein